MSKAAGRAGRSSGWQACCFGAVSWAQVAWLLLEASVLKTGIPNTGFAVYCPLALAEAFSLYRTALDARYCAVPDAIAFGMMLLAAAATWRGATRGENAVKTIAPSSVAIGAAGAFITADMIDRLVSAIDAIAEAIRDGHKREDREHMDKLHGRIDDLMQQLARKT